MTPAGTQTREQQEVTRNASGVSPPETGATEGANWTCSCGLQYSSKPDLNPKYGFRCSACFDSGDMTVLPPVGFVVRGLCEIGTPKELTKALVERAERTLGERARVATWIPPNRRQACHPNSSALSEADKNLVWWTGYANSFGMWVRHSWLVDQRDGAIVETTSERDVYVGVPLPLGSALRRQVEKALGW